MPSPPPSRLEHVTVRLRLSVDKATWAATFGSRPSADAVRRLTVEALQGSDAARSGLIVSIRRDQL